MSYELVWKNAYVKTYQGDTAGKTQILSDLEIHNGDRYYDVQTQQLWTWQDTQWYEIKIGGSPAPVTGSGILGTDALGEFVLGAPF